MTGKKIVLLASALSFCVVSVAQKSKINEANRELTKATEALSKKDATAQTAALQKAKAAIDLAVADESTKENAKAWFTKAAVYMSMQENEATSSGDPYLESVAALEKAFTLDKKYENDPEALPVIIRGAFYAFNNGVNTYNDSKYEAALHSFSTTIALLGADKDKRFIMQPVVDTIRAQAKMLSGYSSFYSGKNEDAIRLLKESAESPYLDNQPNIYLILAQAYEKAGDKALQLATLEAGKKKYPSDTNLSNAVLNYYIASGQQETMVSKLEDAIAKDPDNAELPFNLGIIYEGLAHPTDGSNPANAATYEHKAEAAYQKALSLDAEKGNYNYQLGALYYNQAVEINKSMNNLGAGKEDQVKYNAQLKERDALFAKALPLLEKSRNLYQADAANLTGEEKGLFVQALQALSQIYTIQNQLDKAKEVRDLSKTIH